jgi:DNA-binding transcriptional MerR regulator
VVDFIYFLDFNWHKFIVIAMTTSLVLTTQQLIAAIRELDGVVLNTRTLASWAKTGIVMPSIIWRHRRGRYYPRVYSLSDLARVRLVVRLRNAGVSMPKVRTILAYLSQELQEVLKPKTEAVLIVQGWQGTIVRRPGSYDLEIPTGQLRLPLVDVVEGNREAVRGVMRAA